MADTQGALMFGIVALVALAAMSLLVAHIARRDRDEWERDEQPNRRR